MIITGYVISQPVLLAVDIERLAGEGDAGERRNSGIRQHHRFLKMTAFDFLNVDQITFSLLPFVPSASLRTLIWKKVISRRKPVSWVSTFEQPFSHSWYFRRLSKELVLPE
jgi:hypothetical protein